MNIGILGTGSIARTMAAEFAKVPAFRCEAVCSRQQATGEALAQQFGIPKVYTDYDAMLADPDMSWSISPPPTPCITKLQASAGAGQARSVRKALYHQPGTGRSSCTVWQRKTLFSWSVLDLAAAAVRPPARDPCGWHHRGG